MSAFDRRITPARPDLAAAHLKGVVEAPRYVDGRAMRVVAGVAPMRRAPDARSGLETEAMFGESATIYEIADGWAWGQLDRDGYVGYLPATALRSFLYSEPSIKSPVVTTLSLDARLTIVEAKADVWLCDSGAYVYARHIAPLPPSLRGAQRRSNPGAEDAGPWIASPTARNDESERDFVGFAERFIGIPYLWGGRTSLGLDCSGLVQTALWACGVAAPRDSDMQERALGDAVPVTADLRRGDLIFWKGHVGVMRDATQILHANGWTMSVASEPLAEARTRIIAQNGGPITSIRRLASFLAE
jgi:cell wall-associated NlpC family hydrolase